MCDDHDIDDLLDNVRRSSELTRRRFAALSIGAGISAVLPGLAAAVAVTDAEVSIKTPDGVVDAYFVHPSSGAHPAVLIWTDILGLRASFRAMAKRLAEAGYAVLVPNPYYRIGKAPVVPEGSTAQNEATRKIVVPMMNSLTPQFQVTDATAFVSWLDTQAAVDKRRKMGTAGYCMGGPIVMRTAATFPARIGAGASFHGARLATDAASSPHLLIPKMKAQLLVAIAENDDKNEPQAKDILKDASAKAQVPAEIEVYAGAQHGWCVLDSPVYNQAAAEKAWSRMLDLFKRTLV